LYKLVVNVVLDVEAVLECDFDMMGVKRREKESKKG
jgi:hypothetical protein